MKPTAILAFGSIALLCAGAARADGTTSDLGSGCAQSGSATVTAEAGASGETSSSVDMTVKTCGRNGSSSIDGSVGYTYSSGGSSSSSSGHRHPGITRGVHRPPPNG